MFTLTRTEVESSNNMVEGKISIFSCLTRVLMDSGASHSFVLEGFASVLAQLVEPMESTLVVATLEGEGLLSPSCFLRVDVEIMGHLLLTDLRVLPMLDFDVIFGMD